MGWFQTNEGLCKNESVVSTMDKELRESCVNNKSITVITQMTAEMDMSWAEQVLGGWEMTCKAVLELLFLGCLRGAKIKGKAIKVREIYLG